MRDMRSMDGREALIKMGIPIAVSIAILVVFNLGSQTVIGIGPFLFDKGVMGMVLAITSTLTGLWITLKSPGVRN